MEANGKLIRDNGNSIQTGDGVVFKVPVQGKKDVVTVVGYAAPYFAYSIAGTDATEATTAYTATAADVAQLRKDFEDLKLDIEDILHDQNDINESTRQQLDAISTALAELQSKEPRPKPRRRIGFIQDDSEPQSSKE